MRYRIAAVFAGLALVVALVGGLAAGVSWSTIVARVLAGAAVFAGLGYAAAWILDRYLPELFARLGGKADFGRSEQPGAAAIDIVLPEESPLGAAAGAGPESAEPLEVLEAGVEAGEGEPGRADETPGQAVRQGPSPVGAPAVTGEEVEALPSIEGLDTLPRGAPTASRRAASGASAVHVDPSLAARAVRTQLKRDHEG